MCARSEKMRMPVLVDMRAKKGHKCKMVHEINEQNDKEIDDLAEQVQYLILP